MSLLCEIESFKDALRKCHILLRQTELNQRGLVDIPEGINTTQKFLHYISEKPFASYKDLFEILQKPGGPEEFLTLIGFIGKLLDAIQIIKPCTIRNDKIKGTIINALKRTGHDFIWKELSKDAREIYEKELLNATALYQIIEVVFLMESDELNRSRNPINTLRNSMGDRLPEEYFSELLAGWVVEDALKKYFETKEFHCTLEGTDSLRKIQFVRPEAMGVYDLKISKGLNTFYIEFQRVGKVSRDKNANKIKTYLKQHKYQGSSNKNKVLILWIGEPSQAIYKKWRQKLIFISGLINKNDIDFRDDYIFLPEEYFESALTWEELKKRDNSEILQIIKKS